MRVSVESNIQNSILGHTAECQSQTVMRVIQVLWKDEWPWSLKNQPLSSYAHIRVPLQNLFSWTSESIDYLLYVYVCYET